MGTRVFLGLRPSAITPGVAHVDDTYDLAVILNYYSPYVSGLTETARVVAEGLAARGWRVCVAAAQHDPALPRFESLAGVDVFRAPVAARIGKGVVSPSFVTLARRLARRSRVANLHLPMLEAGLVARLARPVPVATTYQCDVNLSPGMLDQAVVRVMDRSTKWAIARSATAIVSSHDYARSSRVAQALLPKAREIPPPCRVRLQGEPAFREGAGPHIGFLGRIVAEKGLQHLVKAFRHLDDPEARLLVAGDYERVAGGSVIDEVRAEATSDDRVRFLGFLPEERIADFYASLDVFAFPSINSLEAFGIVQVEAMLAGVPVVASDLPGVRMPVTTTGFGRVVPPRDEVALLKAIRTVLAEPAERWREGQAATTARYGPDVTVDGYQSVFATLGGDPHRLGSP